MTHVAASTDVGDDWLRPFGRVVSARASWLSGCGIVFACLAYAAVQTLIANPATWRMIVATFIVCTLMFAVTVVLREWRPTGVWMSTKTWPEKDVDAALERWEREHER